MERKLPESVRDALETLRPVPDTDPERWRENRRAFLLEVRAHKATRESAGASAAPDERGALPDWRTALKSLFGRNLRGARPTVVALRLALVLVLLVGGTTGTVLASRESLPGSWLYPLKVRLESWQIQRARVPEEITRQALVQSQARVEEATRLSTQGKAVPEEVAERYRAQIALALESSGSLDEPVRQQARTEISKTVQHQLETMAQFAERARSDEAGSDDGGNREAVSKMIETMEQTRAELGQTHRQQEGEQPGPPEEVAGEPEGASEDAGNDERDEGAEKPDRGKGPVDHPLGGPPGKDDSDQGPPPGQDQGKPEDEAEGPPDESGEE
ncbi:MAG: DUF5667 domain-containing protein, partial [Anaerolineae bacterium]